MAESLMMDQLRYQIDPRYWTESRRDATVIVLDSSHPYSALLALHLQPLGKPVVSAHWARSSWNENVTLPMDGYFLVPQQPEQEEQRLPQAGQPEEPAAAQPAGAQVASLGAEKEPSDDTDVKPDVHGPDEKPVSDPERPAAPGSEAVPLEAGRSEEGTELSPRRRSLRSRGKLPAPPNNSEDEAADKQSVGDEQNVGEEYGARLDARLKPKRKGKAKVASKPKMIRNPSVPSAAEVLVRKAAKDAVDVARRELNARIAREGPQAAHWVVRTPPVGERTWHGEDPLADALALPLDDEIFNEGGLEHSVPVFDLNDDGRLSKVPVANRAPWKKRDIRVLIRYQARRTIDVNSQNPDDEDKKIDERDLAERMGHLALGRTQAIVEKKNTELGMTWPESFMQRAVAWDRKHYGPFPPLPGALIEKGTPLTAEENRLLAELFVSDFKIVTGEQFFLEGLWVLNNTRRIRDLYNSWRDLARDARAELRLLEGKPPRAKRATKKKSSTAASSSTSTARSRTASSALSTAPSSVDGMDSVSAMEGDEREGQDGLDDAGPVPKKRRLVPDSP